MSSAHTPGEWVVDATALNGASIEDAIGIREASEKGYTIAAVWDDLDGGQGKANARLIAAAPQLLEALISLGHALAEWDGDNDEALLAAGLKGRAAIAAATGKQQ